MLTENTDTVSTLNFINWRICMLRCKHIEWGKARLIDGRFFQSSQEQ